MNLLSIVAHSEAKCLTSLNTNRSARHRTARSDLCNGGRKTSVITSDDIRVAQLNRFC
jgi:hypothetical protein